MGVTIEISPNIFQVVEELQQFKATLEGYLDVAGYGAAVIVRDAAINTMHFKHPTGQFEGSLQIERIDPYTNRVYSDLPYGNRLEWGFYGADSLGRQYNQEGYHFMRVTIDDQKVTYAVAKEYIDAIEAAWYDLIGQNATIGVAVFGLAA